MDIKTIVLGALAVVGIPIVWLVANFLLDKFRAVIIQFIVDKPFTWIGDYVDRACDLLRDKGNKEAADKMRGILADAMDAGAKRFRAKIYDSD